MAKTRKKSAGDAPRPETPQVTTSAAMPDVQVPPIGAPLDRPAAQETEKIAGAESHEAWAPQATGDTTAAADERERIAARAYELYLSRGASDGEAMNDWLEAEREFSR